MMKIGELARMTGTPTETIRYYEAQGLLPGAARSDSNYRLYNPTHAERLAFIRHCRSLDMTLDEIRALLRFRDAPEADCEGVNLLLDEHIRHVALRIGELQQLARQLKHLRSQCQTTQDAARCGILMELTQKGNAEAATKQRRPARGAMPSSVTPHPEPAVSVQSAHVPGRHRQSIPGKNSRS